MAQVQVTTPMQQLSSAQLTGARTHNSSAQLTATTAQLSSAHGSDGGVQLRSVQDHNCISTTTTKNFLPNKNAPQCRYAVCARKVRRA
jgi:hypothetical protein